MDAVKRCTTADFLTPANENELPPFELQIEQVLRYVSAYNFNVEEYVANESMFIQV